MNPQEQPVVTPPDDQSSVPALPVVPGMSVTPTPSDTELTQTPAENNESETSELDDGIETQSSDDQTSSDDAEAEDVTVATTPFSWQASEYMHHNKGASWYILLVAAALIFVAIAILTHQWLTILVFVVMFAAVAVYAGKKPRTLTYTINNDGISVEDRLYPFAHFRSFSVVRDVAWHSIDLDPTQRFMPRLTIMFEDPDFENIVGRVSAKLPRVDREPDLVDRAARFLHF